MWVADERTTMALVAFDFDGTLSRNDLTQLLGREYDVAGEVRGLAEQGLRNEADFAATMIQRAALFEGMPERRAMAAFRRGRLRKGAAELVTDLRRSDVVVAVITGSFEQGVNVVLDEANVAVDHVIANRLEVNDGALTGTIDGPILNGQKDGVLEQLAANEGIPLEQTIAIGNGATDLSMLHVAGTAIGFDPESVVEQHCDEVVTSMRKLRLYFEQHDIIE